MSDRNVLDVVAALAEDRPFRAERVADLTDATLEQVAEESTPYFTVYRSAPEPERSVRQVELRVPTGMSDVKGGIVILEVGGGQAPTKRDVERRFGTGFELSVPTPREPPEAPLYHTYHRDWGRIAFGFGRDDSALLRTVVLDATGK